MGEQGSWSDSSKGHIVRNGPGIPKKLIMHPQAEIDVGGERIAAEGGEEDFD